MIEVNIRDANGKKKKLDIPHTTMSEKEVRNKLKNLEFEKKLLERDIQLIGDKKTLSFAKKRLEEVEKEIKLIEAITGIKSSKGVKDGFRNK